MCSINEIEQANDRVKSKKGSKPREQRSTKNFSEEGSCMKCAEKAVVLVRTNDPFCRDCFLDYVIHKFRATIGKARVIHQGQRVLLAVSGGSSSSAMLDLVIKGLGKAAVKKHRFQPGVVHIDDEGLCGQSFGERNNVKHHIEELSRSVRFPYHHASLQDLFEQEDKETYLENVANLETSNEIPPKSKNRLIGLFEEVTSMTAREDLLSHLYRNLLQKVARVHGYDYIMVGDCGTNLAIRILVDVTQGRGSQLPFSISFKDDRSKVAVLRPMREFMKKEIQFYNHINNVTSFTTPSFSTKASSHCSINRLTEELILGLQTKFPSTVNTVLKTGDKISSNLDSSDFEHCAMCLAPLDSSSGFSDVSSEVRSCVGGACGGSCQNADDQRKMYTGSSGSDCDGSTFRGSCGNEGHVGALGGTGGNGGAIDGTSRSTTGSNSAFENTGGNDEYDGTLRSDCHTLEIIGETNVDTCGGRDSGIHNTGTFSDDCTTGSESIGFDSSTGDVICCKDSKSSPCLSTTEIKAVVGGNMVPDEHIGDHNTDDHSIHLLRSLCYGCKLTYHDMRDGQVTLPKFVTDYSRKQLQRKAMKGQIRDFLLDD